MKPRARYLRFSYPRLKKSLVLPLVAAFWLVVPKIALAQLDEPEPEAKWLLPYCLVALLIGLAVYSMCRPSVRRKGD